MPSLNKHLLHVSGWAILIEGLIAGESTAHELAEESGVRLHTIRKVVNIMNRRGTIHICGWAKDKLDRAIIPIYKVGPGKNVPRPVKSRQQIKRDYLERNRMKKLAGLPHWERKRKTSDQNEQPQQHD